MNKLLPTRRLAYMRGPDLKPARDMLTAAVDLDKYQFS
jgi:hypothetical protein